MDKQEFAVFVSALKTYYSKEEKLISNEQAMNLWYYMLKDIPYNVATAALNKWVALNKWSPSISDIRETAVEILSGETPSWDIAWEQVLTVCRKYGYYQQLEALSHLDEITKTCINRIGFRNICLSENIAVERASFKQIYETEVRRKKYRDVIPQNVQKLIKSVSVKQGDALEMIRQGKGLLPLEERNEPV